MNNILFNSSHAENDFSVNGGENYIDHKKFRLTLVEEGIIENYVKPGILIESVDMWEIKKQNLILAKNQPYAVLVVQGHLAEVSRDAKETAASKEYVGITRAKALIVDSLGHRIVSNFYLSVNKPHIKTKIFNDRNEAIKWLRERLKD